MKDKREKRGILQEDESLRLLIQVWIYRIIMLLTMMAGVFMLHALPISMASWEGNIVVLAYLTVLIAMQGVYHACSIGQAQVSELLMSQVLANLITTSVMYLGAALYMHMLFAPWMMLLTMLVQSALGCLWTIVVNHDYYQRRIPPRTAVIYQDKSELELLYQSPYFEQKYDVIKRIHSPEGDIESLRSQLDGCDVVFALGIPATLTNGIAKLCLQMGIRGYFTPRLGHIIISGAEYQTNFSMPVLYVERAGGHSEYRALKRMFDIAVSIVGLVVTTPVMIATAIAIWLEDHGPVFYRQIRLTKNGREFKIIKFRSMRTNAEADGVARLAGENDSRITRVGQFIRACRIDELPQLINILKGDMSIVGPRPERPEIARQYEEQLPEFTLRLQVKAGLTGLAQVYGRYNTEPYNKLQMDLMYINNMSFLKDLQLIFATLKILFLRESTQGVSGNKATAMNRRQGTNRPA